MTLSSLIFQTNLPTPREQNDERKESRMIPFVSDWFKARVNRLDPQVHTTWFAMMIDQLPKSNNADDLFGEQVMISFSLVVHSSSTDTF